MRWRRRKKAGNGLARAVAEREKSEQRLDAVRRHVVAPLRARGEANQFSEQLRALMEGGRR